jgi:hypothetical protein
LKVAHSDTALIADIAPGAQSLEGYLFPDTYQFSRMMSMQEMAAAMVKQFRQVARQIGMMPMAERWRAERPRRQVRLPKSRSNRSPHSSSKRRPDRPRAHGDHGLDR